MKIDPKLMSQKFRGSLLGVLLGDCYGAPFEEQTLEAGAKLVLRQYFDKLEGPMFKAPQKQFTDDSAMTKSVLRTLLDKKGIDQADLARNFVTEFYKDSRRGYGENVVDVFHHLRVTKMKDPLAPARAQFNGLGSYGNGAAMRIAPVALFCFDKPDKLVQMTTDSAEITHTNKLGVDGAILQAFAVHQSLHLDPEAEFNSKQYISELLEKMSGVERDREGLGIGEAAPYQKQLKEVDRLLNAAEHPTDEEILNVLGHSVVALYSVPTAIYCFLKGLKAIPGIKTTNPFRRSLEYAISLGGDTDTIASMSGAISGAYFGETVIAPNLIKHCEGNELMVKLADELFATATGVK